MIKKEIKKIKHAIRLGKSIGIVFIQSGLVKSLLANFKALVICTKFDVFSRSSPPLEGAGGRKNKKLPKFLSLAPARAGLHTYKLLSSFFANFSAFIFCKKFEVLYEFSPPLKGAGGMLSSKFALNIPLPPFKRGNCSVLAKNLGKNFNTFLLAEQNLTTPASRKRNNPCQLKSYSTNFSNLTLTLLLCLISACNIANPEEGLPAYLQIEKFDFSTTAEQGEPSEQITDVWVFVNDLSLGVYELPATVPSLAVGNQNITIFPVIRENGVRSTPIIYPFYERFETTLDLSIGETVTIKPRTAYVNNAVFELVEEFDKGGHLLKGGNPNAVQIIDEVGQILLGDKKAVEFTSTRTFIDLPTSNGLSVFLEFDYKTDVDFEVGLVGLDPSPTSPVNATVYSVVLCPLDRWNKVYINLQEVLELSQLPGYKLAFRAFIDESNPKNIARETPMVLIDNLKFIRLTN